MFAVLTPTLSELICEYLKWISKKPFTADDPKCNQHQSYVFNFLSDYKYESSLK